MIYVLVGRQSKEVGSPEVATGDPYVHRSCIQSGELGLEHGPRTLGKEGLLDGKQTKKIW